MTTFTQLVNDVVDELLRPDLRAAICQYTNQTVREVHMKPNITAPLHFDSNRFEDVIPVTTDAPFIWTLPNPTLFQNIEALFCPNYGIYVMKKNPSVSRQINFTPDQGIYWYRSGSYIAVAGLDNGNTLEASWFQWPRSLTDQKAVADAARVVWDAETLTYKFAAGAGVPTQNQIDLATHWLLERWEDCIKQGVRTKAFARMGDGDRSRMAFSSYESLRGGLWEAEESSQLYERESAWTSIFKLFSRSSPDSASTAERSTAFSAKRP